MLDDANEPNSPGWWLLRLGKKLADEEHRFNTLEAYHRGDPPVPFGNRRMREAYRRLQKQSRSNYAALISETLLERMKVVGFRSGSSGDATADHEAWQWWQKNFLDADSSLVHRAAVTMSRSYVIVGMNDDGSPLVTPEDPRQVIHESDPANRRHVRAALKTFWDDVHEVSVATVYLPEAIYYFRTNERVRKPGELWQAANWDVDDEDYPDGVAPNPFEGEIPVVPFVNRPNLCGEGCGEFEDVIDVLDRIATGTLDRMVIASMQAYRQRWATGMDPTDEDGVSQSVFDPGADLLWVVPDAGAKFGEFATTDLGPLTSAIASDVQHLAALTRTPPHYLIGQVVNVSGDALAAAETGLVSKVVEREVEFGEAWEQVYRLCGAVLGQDVPDDAEVLWRDPESRTLTELAAANVQLMTAEVPWRTRMRMLDFTPSEIDRMETERMSDALVAGLQQQQQLAIGMGMGPGGTPTPQAQGGGIQQSSSQQRQNAQQKPAQTPKPGYTPATQPHPQPPKAPGSKGSPAPQPKQPPKGK